MGMVTTNDGTEIFYKDWGSGQPIVFSHGWPLSADDWDTQEPSEPIIENWWRQGMMGGAKAHYHGIVAFSQTDFTEDLKRITVPALVMHGDDDQIVPYADAGPLSAELLQNATLKTCQGFPRGMPTTEAETINADLLAFVQS
jgi:non-heme chloroperoxidase